jgi:methyl acetate hydrolase
MRCRHCGGLAPSADAVGQAHEPGTVELRQRPGALGVDPYDDLGRTRLGTAYLIWRLRHSRVLELPSPTASP